MKIVGWDALYTITRRRPYTIRRFIKLYGFPKPTLVREGQTAFNVWEYADVMVWLHENQDLLHVKPKQRSGWYTKIIRGEV